MLAIELYQVVLIAAIEIDQAQLRLFPVDTVGAGSIGSFSTSFPFFARPYPSNDIPHFEQLLFVIIYNVDIVEGIRLKLIPRGVESDDRFRVFYLGEKVVGILRQDNFVMSFCCSFVFCCLGCVS